ncbi:MAG: ATP-binding protein, partial [Oscillospiraceae bacterium]
MAQETKRNKNSQYTNNDITSLKGADRVRKRPSVIFGSDGIEGCQHSAFEIVSNSIDEAREGYGDRIIVSHFADDSIEVEDFARGIPVDYNENEKEYNWKLVFCEMYAGSKYNNLTGGAYEYSLGLNGLGLCATQYASEYMDVEIFRDGFRYELHFKGGNASGQMIKEETKRRKTGSRIRWKPDLKVFTEIKIEPEYFVEMLKRQSIVNAGVTFEYRHENQNGDFETSEFTYANGIEDYVAEIIGDDAFTAPQLWTGERVGRDREDMPDYKVKINVAFAFSNNAQRLEYFHN